MKNLLLLLFVAFALFVEGRVAPNTKISNPIIAFGKIQLADFDGDGYSTPGDCNDFDPFINPGATEICGNSTDENCNGSITDGCSDVDGDGYAAPGDCNDNNPNINPGENEICGNQIDEDCDGYLNNGCGIDNDGDGYTTGNDCNDNNPNINPGENEICGNSVDENCNGSTTDGCQDNDGDGYRANQDCNDADSTIHPGALEICNNNIDEDCDGSLACDFDQDGFSAGHDCNDNNPAVNPGAVEVCGNAIDENCDRSTSYECVSMDSCVMQLTTDMNDRTYHPDNGGFYWGFSTYQRNYRTINPALYPEYDDGWKKMTNASSGFFYGAASWYLSTPDTADNWLVLEGLKVKTNILQMSWRYRYPDMDYRDGYEILLSVGHGNDLTLYTTKLFTVKDNDPITNTDTGWNYMEIDVDVTAFIGRSVNLAFHHNAFDQYILMLDDLYLAQCGEAIVSDVNEPIALSPIDFSLAPNPSSGNVTLYYRYDADGPVEVTVTDVTGRTTFAEVLSAQPSGNVQLPLSNQQPGIYFVQMKYGDSKGVQKLIISK